jgi:DNA invertase Pin-like site-specific DNA recombinase
LLRRFHNAGAPVWSLREPWTETADASMAELLASIYAWIARAESARRSERTKAGIARRMREDPDFRPGRKSGATDKKPRKRSGYVARYERERAVKP